MATTRAMRMPAWFLTHGAGPLPLMQPKHPMHADMVDNLKGLAAKLPQKPRAILIVSGHFEEDVPTVVKAENPGIFHDFSGFGDEAFDINYPAQGSPAVAVQAETLLRQAGFKTNSVVDRGFDHGVYVPLKLVFPDADIPVVQMSMASSLDPKFHIKMGKALAPLREEGVLIVGSGGSFHNAKLVCYTGSTDVIPSSKVFDDWLHETLCTDKLTPEQRLNEFANWSKAPGAWESHPREEHLIPCHVCLGTALGSKAETIFSGIVMAAAVSSFAWY